jgi:GAF domain-containing protein
VLQSGEALLLEDVSDSDFADLARGGVYSCPSLISAVIRDAAGRIGVINISEPCEDRRLTQDDLRLVEVFARMIGQSIHTFQLQKLVDSRMLQMAVLQERRERSSDLGRLISPDPSRLAKLVARNFYRDLTNAGFGPNAVIAVASEVLSTLHATLAKHKDRREREASAGPKRRKS